MVQKKLKYYKKIKNSFMLDGKSHVAEKLFLNTLKNVQSTSRKEHITVFKLALKNILTPISTITIKKRKFQRSIPFFIAKEKRISQTIKYLGFLNKKNKKTFIYSEIIKAANNKGVFKNNLNVSNQQSFVNKNFAHYRWFL